MSVHYYFRDFVYCDGGMILWLLVLELISVEKVPLSELINERQQSYPCSREINFKGADVKAGIQKVKEHFAAQKPQIDEIDGLSLEFADWRMNLRSTNTEPLLRLNIEARVDQHHVGKQLEILRQVLEANS